MTKTKINKKRIANTSDSDRLPQIDYFNVLDVNLIRSSSMKTKKKKKCIAKCDLAN